MPLFPPPTLQVTLTNPTLDCGVVPTSLAVGLTSLPTGWSLRTCVPISVTVTTGVSCSATQAAETTWSVMRPSDQTVLLTGTGVGTSLLQYCGAVDEQLQFVIKDTQGGAWGVFYGWWWWWGGGCHAWCEAWCQVWPG